jgi:hypothetical protein
MLKYAPHATTLQDSSASGGGLQAGLATACDLSSNVEIEGRMRNLALKAVINSMSPDLGKVESKSWHTHAQIDNKVITWQNFCWMRYIDTHLHQRFTGQLFSKV